MLRARMLIAGSAALLFSASIVIAQDNVPANDQPKAPSSGTSSPDHTIPPPPEAQPQAPIADQSKPSAVGPAQANTAGSVTEYRPLGATGQTMPSTISAENAALDKLPIVALQLPLSDEEKAQIVGQVSSAKQENGKSELDNVGVADYVPWGAELQEFPEDLTKQIPRLGAYKYLQADKRTLVVDAPNRVVVGELER